MRRLFSVEEANALIPRLTESFEALARLRGQAESARASLQQLETRGRSNGKDLGTEIRDRQDEIARLSRTAQAAVEGIAGLGCEVKDAESGLVDFPSDRSGRTVYLCWKLGETAIRFWHELSTGFAGRQPL